MVPGARQEYLRRLELSMREVDWELLSYGLMSSHGHVSTEAGLDPCTKFMLPTHSGFAAWWNRQMRARGGQWVHTRGPVFADRPTTVVIPPEKIHRLHAYIHNNPVRAGVVPSPELSAWTSHRAFLGLEQPHPALNLARAYELSGFECTLEGRRAFHDYTIGRLMDPQDPVLSGTVAERDRLQLRSQLQLPAELYSPRATSVDRNTIVSNSIVAGETRYPGDGREVLEVVARSLGLDPQAIQSRSRTKPLPEARAICVQTWLRLGRTISEITPLLGISLQAGCYLHRRPVRRGIVNVLCRKLRYNIAHA